MTARPMAIPPEPEIPWKVLYEGKLLGLRNTSILPTACAWAITPDSCAHSVTKKDSAASLKSWDSLF